MRSDASISCRRLLRLVLVVGATIGVALAVLKALGARGQRFYTDVHRREASCENRECLRALWEGYAMPERLPASPIREDHEVRAPFRSSEGPVHGMEHLRHQHRHHHREQDKESDDESEEDDDSEDDDDDNDSSESGSQSDQSDSGSRSGGIQSSAITRLGGVNIGNTITIINVGSGGALPSGSQQGSGLGGGVPSNANAAQPAGDGAGRAAISAAAVRAFCGATGCSPSQIFQGSVAGSGSTTFSMAPSSNASNGLGDGSASAASSSNVGNSTGATRNEAEYANSIRSDSSVLSRGAAKWFVLVAILVQLCMTRRN
jgi:hypothetical protein